MRTNTIHTVTNGFCTVCGETEEWLRDNGIAFELVAQVEQPAPVAAKSMALAIEMAETRTGYAKIHKAGCRDLRDGMPLGEATTLKAAAALAEDATYWGYEEDEWVYAPCVTLPKG